MSKERADKVDIIGLTKDTETNQNADNVDIIDLTKGSDLDQIAIFKVQHAFVV